VRVTHSDLKIRKVVAVRLKNNNGINLSNGLWTNRRPVSGVRILGLQNEILNGKAGEAVPCMEMI
jgi:hypothetical protein